MNDPSPLQFDRAELAQAPSAVRCSFCQRTPLTQYFSVNGKPACEPCSVQVAQYLERSPDSAQWTLAASLGLGAAIAAAVAYAVSIMVTGYNLSIVSIGVGWLVGRAVRKGASGGRAQQLLAVALTYFSVSAALIGRGLWTLRERLPPLETVLSGLLTAPFRLVGFPVGTLIVGFGLYEAWRVTRKAGVQITGPHPVVTTPAPASNG